MFEFFSNMFFYNLASIIKKLLSSTFTNFEVESLYSPYLIPHGNKLQIQYLDLNTSSKTAVLP
ncbi:hypothetical protein BALH_2143 [Bacillus thuringiensis str. Al Hakam]|nr:hypothetical protein BALH_2143 [Bacillus thuringiensis str. Al Hakam]